MARRFVLTTAVLLAATLPVAGCGQMFRFIGDRVADAITQKTSSLADVSAGASYVTNLYPGDAKTVETETMPELWKGGGGWIVVNMLKRAGVGMWEIEGQVTARKGNEPPVPLTYMGKGSYSLFLPAGDRAARTIEIRTSSGQVASFPIKPAAPLKLKAVNGKAGGGATVDLTRDLVLDLEDPGSAGKLKVSLIGSVLGVRTMMDVAVCKPAKRLVIPAVAFKHLGVSASMANFLGIDPGANHVLVERYEGGSVARPGAAGAAYAIGKSWAHAPVTVVGDVKNAAPITIRGEVPNPRGPLVYELHKQQAFYAPPVDRAKRLAIGSLRLRGVLLKQVSNVSTSYGYNTIITTTTTTTWKFPKQPPAAWDRFLDDAAGGIGRAFGGSVVSPDRMLASPLYQQLETVKETDSEQLVERSWRKSRPVFPQSAAALLGSVSSTFALDRPHVRLLAEAGADALLTADIDLQVGAFAKDPTKVALVPSMRFALVGPANGYTVGPTMYASGQVLATDGVTFSEAELSDLGALRRIARLDDLLGGLKGALARLKDEERKAGYEAIWALQ